MSYSVAIRTIAGKRPFNIPALNGISKSTPTPICRSICTSPVLENSRQAGKFRTSKYRTNPLTYEQFHGPQDIAHKKTWNSWNTSNTEHPYAPGGNVLRQGETAVEDTLIRRFMVGTWHNLISSEVIIKRQFNIIRVAAIVYQGLPQRKMYFLIGYSEELLSYLLQCPVKLELQTIHDRKQVVFKHV